MVDKYTMDKDVTCRITTQRRGKGMELYRKKFLYTIVIELVFKLDKMVMTTPRTMTKKITTRKTQ